MRRSAKKIRATHYRTGQVQEFWFDPQGNLIRSRPVRGSAPLLYGPGLFDVQVNGFAGIDYNHPEFTAEQFRESIHAMWRFGTTQVMPTIITGRPGRMASGMRTIREGVERFSEVRACVVGIHQEGPYFANVEGVRGAHPPESIIPPCLSHFDRLQNEAGGMIRMVTMAPELRGALPFIRALSRRGIVMSIGHTHATPKEIDAGVRAGMVTCTHLGNGSAQVLPRHHNYMLAQLGDDRIYASFIADGYHLPSFVMKSFFRAKPRAQSILTTDCMAAAGAAPGKYTIGQMTLEVGPDKVARHPGKQSFAGSAITMDHGLATAVRLGEISLQDAWDMSSIHPWNLMRRASLVKQPRIDETFIVAHYEREKFRVLGTVMKRRLVHAAFGSCK